MKLRNKRRSFISNKHAVLGLPLRLTVSLIIGTIVLISILSYVLNPCLFPQRMIVSVTPMITTLSGSDPENVTFIVFVNDSKGHIICNASVIVEGLGGAGSGFSDETGRATVHMQIQLQDGFYEGYLDILVKAPCYESFEHQDIIKVVKLLR
ncbi:MAG: hypothetical protein BV458_00075 [Thermoplasmata archaeon M9B2D]|nr:MAG: hypothetical protein BV458_00075 [Thermoplasmata archaeon M9B2D]